MYSIVIYGGKLSRSLLLLQNLKSRWEWENIIVEKTIARRQFSLLNIEVEIFGVTILKTTVNSLLCANDSSWRWSCVNESRWPPKQEPIFSLKGPAIESANALTMVSKFNYNGSPVIYYRLKKIIPLGVRAKPSLCYFFFDLLIVWITECLNTYIKLRQRRM